MAPIGKKLRVSVCDFMASGIQPGCRGRRSTAGRDAIESGTGTLRRIQEDAPRAPREAEFGVDRSDRLHWTLSAADFHCSQPTAEKTERTPIGGP